MGPKAPKAKPSEERTGSSISSRETRCYVGGRQARHRRKGRKASMYVSTCIASGNCRPPRARSVGGPSDAFRQPTLLFSSPPRGRTRKSFTLCPFLLPSHPPSLPPSAVRIPETNNGNGANYTDKRVLSSLSCVCPIQCQTASRNRGELVSQKVSIESFCLTSS